MQEHPVELAKYYDEQGADELVFLDISASFEGRQTMVEVVKKRLQNLRFHLRWEAEFAR